MKNRLFVIATTTQGGIRIDLRVSSLAGRVGLITNVRCENIAQFENATVRRITERLRRNERVLSDLPGTFDRLVTMARDLAHSLSEFGYRNSQWSEAGDGANWLAHENVRRLTATV